MKEEYYLEQLEEELVVALGCTEPVAVAYAAALAKKEAGPQEIESIHLKASVNIYKNAIGVFIPGTREMGAGIAAALGATGGLPDHGLQVLEGLTEEDITRARELCARGAVTSSPAPPDTPSLYIDVLIKTRNHSGRAVVAWKHDLVMELERDGELVFVNDISQIQEMSSAITPDDLREIWAFVSTVDTDRLDIIRQAVLLNERIAEEGMTTGYGLEVGPAIACSHGIKGKPFDKKSASISDYCAARTAAASDARMAG
ncbi:MAG TPA: serine dehydratase subunit alpha family protein, partial [Clostridiaceae bacterium]|nr:serine dehydratase subunit alpha family protein [Clostridiaceae bacterium]